MRGHALDEHIFDSIVRSLGDGASRRRLVSLFGGGLAGGTLLALAGEDAEGGNKKGKKRKKKPCAPCRIRRKGKCKGVAPDGAACGTGKVCRAGTCVASCPEGQACGNGGTCQNGQCVAPKICSPACVLPETCVNGVCGCPTAQTCGDICCDGAPVCQGEACSCDGNFNFCSCPAGEDLCAAESFSQCCLPGDTCDPVQACITNTCSAGNTFCTPEWALCNGSDQCSCASTATGDIACVESLTLPNCPDTSECNTDVDCGAGAVCVNPCCPEGDIRGVCITECAANRSAPSRSGEQDGKPAKRQVFGQQ